MRMPLRSMTRPSATPEDEVRVDQTVAIIDAAIAAAAPASPAVPAPSSEPRVVSLTVEQAIGAQIRQHRKRLDITSAELAATARISPGMISKIENGQISSSLATLTAIASALNVPIASLFAGYDDRRDCSFVKAGQGAATERRGTKAGHIYELLAQSLGTDVAMEPFLITLPEGAAPYSAFRHSGVELIYMLTGSVGYRHADKLYHLEPGDTLYFDASVQHGPEELYSLPMSYLSIIVYPKE